MTKDPVLNVLLDNAAFAVWMGSDKSFGLDYLNLTDEERRIADEVLSRVAESRVKEWDYLAHRIALSMWGPQK